jgi:uncharacterized protein YkwD
LRFVRALPVHRKTPLIVVIAALAIAALTVRPVRADSLSAWSWLARLNFYRSMAMLPPVAEDPALSVGPLDHARYMVRHDVIKHVEGPLDAWATLAGAKAAAVSNLAGSWKAEPDAWAIDNWMQAPFHAIGILDPALKDVGFGIFRENNGQIQTAAALDVIHGRVENSEARFPVLWPAHGTSVPIGAHTSEYPSPLSSCSGYSSPAGLPLIVQLGSGGLVPTGTKSMVWLGKQKVEHCIFDETTYRNPNAADEQLGRSILAARDAIVIVPKYPLKPGATYRVALESSGHKIDWSFKVQ